MTTCCSSTRAADKLYVPTDQVHTVRRYTGGETPSLHRMGGGDFEKAKSRVRSAVQEIAQELVVLYRRRLASPGHAFRRGLAVAARGRRGVPVRGDPDQLRAIEEVKADMERPVPMDRLVCGDVGFGKTEIALRAAVQSRAGRQAGRGARADDAAREPARPDVPRAVRQLPRAGRGAVALLVVQGARRRSSRACRAARSTSSSGRIACCRRTSGSRTSACS